MTIPLPLPVFAFGRCPRNDRWLGSFGESRRPDSHFDGDHGQPFGDGSNTHLPFLEHDDAQYAIAIESEELGTNIDTWVRLWKCG